MASKMAALAKLAVGLDVGTSRPATATCRCTVSRRATTNSEQQPCDQACNGTVDASTPQAGIGRLQRDACSNNASSDAASTECAGQKQPCSTSRTLAQAAAQHSRPATPHATKPYKGMPPLLAARQPATISRARLTASRPATASQVLPAQACSRAGTACSSSSSSSYYQLYHTGPDHPGCFNSPHALRPGSAAAARILRAMSRACVATPSSSARAGDACGGMVAAASTPAKVCAPCTQHHQQRRQQQDRVDVLSSEACTAVAAATATLPLGEVQLPPDGSRPATAAVQAVLATAAARDDGVEKRLAAIQHSNCAYDHSADLNIVSDEMEAASEPHQGSFVGSGGAPPACLGQQAAAMVLNLDDFVQSTPEVLEIELESLDVEQLTLLQTILLC